MRKDIIKLGSSAVVGLGLCILYFSFLARYAVLTDWSGLTEIEGIILVTQVLRAVALGIIGHKYQIQPIVPIIVFSLEALLIPPLLVLIIFSGDAYYASLMGVVLTSWFGASALVLTPYTAYSFTKSMVRDNSLTSIIFVGILEFVSAYFLAELLLGTTSPVSGLTGLGTLIISQIRSLISSGGLPNPNGDLAISAGLVLFFLGMLFYFTLGAHAIPSQIRVPFIMVVPLFALLLGLVWTIIASQFDTDLLVILTAPAVVLFVTIWGTARGK